MTPKIILTTVPTGLGHIRVTNALIETIPPNIIPTIIGDEDATSATIYRIISLNIYLRKIFEFTQSNNTAEKISQKLIKAFQKFNSQKTRNQIYEEIQNTPEDQDIHIVSTHPYTAQSVLEVVKKLENKNKIKQYLVVTDDSPQRSWLVECDVIFVPSEKTKSKMLELFKTECSSTPQIHVVNYPISKNLYRKLSDEIFFNKKEQLDPDNPQRARISIPVSGAAVQLDFYQTIIDELTCEEAKTQCREFSFSVVTKEGSYTKGFIDRNRFNPHIAFHIGTNDQQTVKIYDELFKQLNPPSLEITKPSEQCFKALTQPNELGGVLLLLTQPIGRQEYDNIEFLIRKGFIPSKEETEIIHEAIKNEKNVPEDIQKKINTWRGLRLPENPIDAANFIINCLKYGVFMKMLGFKNENESDNEIGVNQIWDKILKAKPVYAQGCF